MPKPIALFHYPVGQFDDNDEKKTPVDVMAAMTKYIPEYHWLCFPLTGIRIAKLQVFFEKDFTEIEYVELIEKITKQINKLTPVKDA